jgi:ribosomal protein L31E
MDRSSSGTNITHLQKKNLGESSNGKRKKQISSELHGSTSDEDEEGIEMHLRELQKEAKKKRAIQDVDKIIKLQNVTVTFRLRKIEEFPSATRAQRAIEEYPYLMWMGHV